MKRQAWFLPPPHSLFPAPHLSAGRPDQDFSPALEFYFVAALNSGRGRAGARADGRADGRAFAAAGDTADDRAEPGAAAGADGGRFTFAAAFNVALFVNLFDRILTVNLHHLSRHSSALAIPQADAVERERQFGFAGELAGFIDFGDVTFDCRVGVGPRRQHRGGEPIAVSRFFSVDLVL